VLFALFVVVLSVEGNMKMMNNCAVKGATTQLTSGVWIHPLKTFLMGTGFVIPASTTLIRLFR
jgi:hypothetical protein